MYFIAFKVVGVDERNVESRRSKMAVACYVGPRAPAMQKAGAVASKAKLTQAWNGVAVWYDVATPEDFTREDLKGRLLQVCLICSNCDALPCLLRLTDLFRGASAVVHTSPATTTLVTVSASTWVSMMS